MHSSSFPHRQQPYTKDCGATCLQLIAEYYGRKFCLKRLREYSHISREGASLMGISDAAEKIGFKTLGLCPTIDMLKRDILLPCILFWEQNHYVVCYKIKSGLFGTRYYISDPATMKTVYTEQEFGKKWLSTRRNNEDRGILLMLTPTDKFYEIEDDIKSDNKHSITSYFSYLSPHKSSLLQLLCSMALLMLTGLITPFLTQSLVDVGIRGGNFNFVLLFLLCQLVITLTNMGIGIVSSWISAQTGARINLSLVSDFWSKILKLPVSFFDTKVTGDIMERIDDYDRIKNFLLNHSVNLCFAIINFIIYTCILAFYNTTVLLIFLGGNVFYIGWTMLFLRPWKRLDYQNFEAASQNNNKVLQMLQGVVDIKLNNEERLKRWEWEKIQAKIFRLSIKSLKLGQIQSNISSLIINITNIIISAIVAKNVIDGEMTLGMMMSITYLTAQIGGPISYFVNFVRLLQDTRTSLERINEIKEMTDEESDIKEKVAEVPLNQNIYFEEVNFSYDGSERTRVLCNVSFVIPHNKVTAIVGNSGSGKTTIMKLIQGLYSPNTGTVRIGDIPINAINPHVYRDNIGSVMQDGYIFSDTIARNIATGSSEINRKQLYFAAKMANIDGFINKNPLGYNMKIGMEGVGVSQGQRQRILIARAIYKSPEILIFDEATNALDSSNEKIIMSNLEHYFKGKTVVIAAHRLSTIRNADQIIVMKDGKVAEVGSHNDLMSLVGEYYNLIKNQL